MKRKGDHKKKKDNPLTFLPEADPPMAEILSPEGRGNKRQEEVLSPVGRGDKR